MSDDEIVTIALPRDRWADLALTAKHIYGYLVSTGGVREEYVRRMDDLANELRKAATNGW